MRAGTQRAGTQRAGIISVVAAALTMGLTFAHTLELAGCQKSIGAVTSKYRLIEDYDAPSLARLRRRRLVRFGRSSTRQCAVSLS